MNLRKKIKEILSEEPECNCEGGVGCCAVSSNCEENEVCKGGCCVPANTNSTGIKRKKRKKEQTTSGAAGAYSQPLFGTPIKRKIAEHKLGGTCTCKKCGAQAETIDRATCEMWIEQHNQATHNDPDKFYNKSRGIKENSHNLVHSDQRDITEKERKEIDDIEMSDIEVNDIEMSDIEVNDRDTSAKFSEKLEKYEECGGGDSTLMCNEHSCSFTLSITQFDANSVRMDAQLCGQGTIKFYKDGEWKMTSIGTCPNYTRSVGLLGLYIESNPASPYYKTTYYFNAVLECLNGQVYEQTVCVGPDMQVKPCPASPSQPMPNNAVAEGRKIKIKESTFIELLEKSVYSAIHGGIIKEALTDSDEKRIGVLARKELKDYEAKLERKVDQMINKAFKGKDFETNTLKITKNAIIQLYKALWIRRSFWTEYIKNTPS